MEWPRIFVATGNSQPWCYSDYMWTMMREVAVYPGKVDLFRMTHSKPDIRNNRGVKAFLQSDADILVRMDLDQSYPDDFLVTMVPLVQEYKIIGPEIYDRWEQNDHRILCFSDYKPTPWDHWIDCTDASGIKAYPYTHTNNLYAREAVESVPLPWWNNPLTEDGCDQQNHPDFELLDKFREYGYPTYLNHNVEVYHLFIGRACNQYYRRWKGGEHAVS